MCMSKCQTYYLVLVYSASAYGNDWNSDKQAAKKFRLRFSGGWQHQVTKSGGTFGPDILQLSPPFHWVNKVLVGDITGKEHAIGMKNDGFYEIDLWWLLFANALLSSLMCNRLQVLHLWSSFKHTSILVFCFAPSRFLINNALCQLLIARKILESHSK